MTTPVRSRSTIVFSVVLAASGCCGEAEELSHADMFGATATLIGISAVSAFAPPEDKEPTLAEASVSLIEPAFAAPFFLLAIGVGGCLGASLCGRTCHVVLCAGGAATCAALSQLSLKLVTLSVREAADGGGIHPVTIAAVCALFVTAPSQLTLLNAALGASRASVAVPLYQGATVSLTTLSGGVAFHEFAAMQLSQGLGYGVGLAVATAGLLVLARGGEEAVDEAVDEEVAGEAQAAVVDASMSAYSLDLALGTPPGEPHCFDRLHKIEEADGFSEQTPPGRASRVGLLATDSSFLTTGSSRRSIATRRASTITRLVAPPGFMLGLATAAVTPPQPSRLRARSASVSSYCPPPVLAELEAGSPSRPLRPRSATVCLSPSYSSRSGQSL